MAERIAGLGLARLDFNRGAVAGDVAWALQGRLPVISRRLPRYKTFHPFTNFVTNATEDGKSLFIASNAGRRRVFKASVNAFGLSGEHRAGLFRIVADCNYSIEFLANELVYRFRPMTGNINADLPHHLNRLGTNVARLHAGAFDFKSGSALVSQNAFGHLTAGGIPGTKYQYSSLHIIA
jgi:hypothetical protein